MFFATFVEKILIRFNLYQHVKFITSLSTAMVMRVIRILVSFTFNVIIARMLGAEGVGVYFLSYTVIRISTIISTIGLNQTLMRFTAVHASKDEWNHVAGAVRYGILIAGSLAIGLTALVFLASPVLAGLFSESQLIEPLRWMSLSILPWTLVLLFSHMLQGINRIEDSLFVQTIGIPLVNIPILVLLSAGYGVVGAAISYTISAFLILLLGYRLWRRFTPELKNVIPEFDVQKLLQSSIPLFWYDFTVLVVGMMDTILLGFFTTSESVGIYNTVKRVSNLASAVLTAVNVVVAPQFAAMYASEELARMEKLARNSVRIVLVVSIPVMIVFFVFPALILGIFGAEFVDGSNALRILASGQLVNATTGSVGILLIMSGNERLMRNIAFFTSIMYILLLIILTQAAGYEGAAWASAISSTVRNLITMLFVYQVLNIMTLPFPERFIHRWFRTNIEPGSSSS